MILETKCCIVVRGIIEIDIKYKNHIELFHKDLSSYPNSFIYRFIENMEFHSKLKENHNNISFYEYCHLTRYFRIFSIF